MQYIAAITNPSQRAEVERWAAFTNSFTAQQTIQCVHKVFFNDKTGNIVRAGEYFYRKN